MSLTDEFKSFASDNHSGAHPEVLQAIIQANEGFMKAYSADPITEKAMGLFKKHFGNESKTYLVFTGTAANVIALKSLCPSFGAIVCAETSHLNVDECGAPEAHIGSKLLTVKTPDGKLTPELIEAQVALFTDVHKPKIKAISISQTTEYGTVYSIEEIKRIAEFSKKHGYYLHLDGARLSNAACALNTDFKSMTYDSGVDLISFGGTKNGLLGAEAIVCFRQELFEPIEFLQKQSMQLGSKMRFLSAQFSAFFENELWKKNASHSNELAKRLSNQLSKIPGVSLTQKTEANAIFAIFPPKTLKELQKKFYFYVWNERTQEVRLMTSFATPERWVDEFIQAAKT